MRHLAPDELLAVCDPATLPFTTTDDLTPLDGIFGQERAVSAMESGIGLKDTGYNLFVLATHASALGRRGPRWRRP